MQNSVIKQSQQTGNKASERKNLQLIRKDAFSLLKELAVGKRVNESVKRGVRVRLELLLEETLAQFNAWNERVRHRLNKTRQQQIERDYQKRIQALRIVIYMLTPTYERMTDEPSFIVKKEKKV